jgi:hypothetical protein
MPKMQSKKIYTYYRRERDIIHDASMSLFLINYR